MLSTNIKLDKFQPTLARLVERLEIEGAEEREWIVGGVVNLSAVLEYGKHGGVLHRTGVSGSKESGPAAVRVVVKRVEEEVKIDVDEVKNAEEEARRRPEFINPPVKPRALTAASFTASEPDDHPACFKLALQFAFP